MVVLVRGHGDALETFWVRRSDAVSYMPGFDAFLGGGIEPSDAELAVAGTADEQDRVLRACAIREAFEETGVLVALDGPLAGDAHALAKARGLLLDGEASFPELARAHGWSFRAAALTAAGRWQTPAFTTVRFDAQYFLVRVPEGQEPVVRPGELASGAWIAPAAALERWRRGEAAFAAPILHTLLALAGGEAGLEERLLSPRERMAPAARRIELKWGIVLHPMKTRPLPPATHTNAYLVGEREMALVDPGSADPAEVEGLLAAIAALEAEGRRLKLILLTHHHPDHVAGIEAVRARHPVPVAAHAETAKRVRCDLAVKDGDWIPLLPGAGDWNLRVLHTPGHTQGHLCFFHPRTGSLFTGDHIPGGAGTVIIDPPEGDMRRYVESLERLAREPVVTLFPAHGAPQGAAQRRIRGLIEHRLKREAMVLAALDDEPRSLDALVEVAYADTARELWGYAERSLLAHLVKLEAEGRAASEDERWRRVEA